ncbi:hypothetical protein Fot_28857 [Forsythia ovata]|uniref:Uncharacterized protein n=1 Tax=Forsythia ovata TaxID=205694 RepID=A0ABD1TQ74_9LAMI
MDDRTPLPKEMNNNDEHALFSDAIKVLGESSKFPMPKMQKYSEKGNPIDNVREYNTYMKFLGVIPTHKWLRSPKEKAIVDDEIDPRVIESESQASPAYSVRPD